MGCQPCWKCQALLALLLAVPLAQALPLAASALSQPPTGATNATEVDALIIFTNALLPTEAQQAAYGWQMNQDPCGYVTCGPRLQPTCNWQGLSCINWHITGIALDPSAQANNSAGVSRILSPYIVFLPQLQTLQLPGQRLQGPLTRVMGFLSNLQTMDISNNQLTGFLPTTWGLLNNLGTLNLSGNSLEGSVPASWSMMTSLKTLDLTRNSDICSPNMTAPNTSAPNITSLSPSSSAALGALPICNTTVAAAQAAASTSPAPASPAAASPAASPSPEAGPPPGGGIGYHTSPGINVSVSVLVGGCFLLGLFAGFVRIRGQQRQHRRLLMGLNQQRHDAIADLQRLARNSPAMEGYTAAATPFCGTPRLVLGPDGQQLALARKFKQQTDPKSAGDGSDAQGTAGEAGQSGSPSASTAQAAAGSSPSRFAPGPRQHQTRLYTAVLEVDSQEAQNAPTPVDLVSAAESSSGEPSRSAGQPSALHLESRQPPGNAGGLLSRVSASFSQLSNHNAQGSSRAVEPANDAGLASSSSNNVADTEAGQTSQQSAANAQRWRSWWPFRRA